jgi:L-seryl-tRNA(Ser) seleniumtransferase
VTSDYDLSVPDYRVIPSIEQLRQRPAVATLERDHGHAATTTALREAAAEIRDRIAKGEAAPGDTEAAACAIEVSASARLASSFRGSLRRVINATGVVIHTNLGRAPLSAAAIARLTTIAQGYSNLEYDVAQGSRGSRSVHAEHLLTALCGAEAALVVNNNAAATMLILAGLAAGREVIVSRGELVEIGGGFRVPDVMAQSGAVLREVGTTNRTRVADYRAAIGPKTAAILRVHPSNFRIEGFTERPALAALVAAAHDAQLPLLEDLGSGCLLDSIDWEPTVQASVAAGVDVMCFSGDKLLGGPQAGIVVGRKPLVDQLRKHPLMRALRVDKLTLAALEGTLLEYLAGRAAQAIPVLRMITLTADAIEARARALGERLAASGWSVALVSGGSAIGGGSAPGIEPATVLLSIERQGLRADALDAALRALDPPVIARIADDVVVLDLRTVDASEDDELARLIASVAANA